MLKYGITINIKKDELLSDHAKKLIKDYYMAEGEKSPQEAYARASVAWSAGDLSLAQRLYEAVSNNWFMFASPVLSNAPKPNESAKGMPISCFLCYVGDTLHSLINHTTEERWLSVKGGGVGGHWSDVRAVSDIAPGPIPFIHTIDADMVAYKQGKTRKGSYAAYLDVSHSDIMEFINIRVPTGDINRKALNINHAVNITDNFMDCVVKNKPWNLVDPKTKEVRDTLKARDIWEKILEIRFRTGEPYLNFIDTANAGLPEALKSRGLKIHGSNLCNEIHLPTNDERTAVCCLSSLNLEYYNEWKSTNLVADIVRMLDNILDYFIAHAQPELQKAIFSAKQERSIGLGAMGFHSLLQRRLLAFECLEARQLNEEIFKEIKEKAIKESKKLAKERGEALDLKGTGLRNAHLLAIAPNANSSILAGTSPSIEPINANAFVHRTRAGSYLVKNKYLEKELENVNCNNDSTWSSIISNGGSVSHIDSLAESTKIIFKTAIEINQDWVITHAADRQKFICQGQSVNLFFGANTSRATINKVHIDAWRKGLKGLYYLRTEAGSKAESVGEKVERVALKDAEACDINDKECIACQG